MNTSSQTVFFPVEDAFEIAGRGVVLVTAADLSLLRFGVEYPIEFTAADGRAVSGVGTRELLLSGNPKVEKSVVLARSQRKSDFAPSTIVSVLVPLGAGV